MSEKLHTIELQLNGPNEALSIFGTNDKFLKIIEEQLNVSIVTRGEKILVSGDKTSITCVEEVLLALLTISKKGLQVTERDVVYAVDLAKDGKINQFETLFEDEISKTAKGRSIRVKTL